MKTEYSFRVDVKTTRLGNHYLTDGRIDEDGHNVEPETGPCWSRKTDFGEGVGTNGSFED